MPGQPALEAFAARLASAGIVIARSGQRPRFALAAPLPLDMSGERELADVFLTARHPVDAVREAIAGSLPPGHRLIELHDVWLGEAALAAQLEAADYQITLAPSEGTPAALTASCQRLLEADSVPRARAKGGRIVTYDLRPLLADIAVHVGGSTTTLHIRTRFSPERGAGRPDEVLAVLAEDAGLALVPQATSRVRLWLASELRVDIASG